MLKMSLKNLLNIKVQQKWLFKWIFPLLFDGILTISELVLGVNSIEKLFTQFSGILLN